MQPLETLNFAPEDFATRGAFEGPYTSEAFDRACQTIGTDHPRYEEYRQWALARNGQPETGSLIVPVENDAWLKRGNDTLVAQMDFLSGKAPMPELQFTLSPAIKDAFEKARHQMPEGPARVVSFAITRETVAHLLREEYPDLDVHYVSCWGSEATAAKRNKIVEDHAPEASEWLRYTSNPETEKGNVDIVHANSWLHYFNTAAALKEKLQLMTDLDPKWIVLSNTVVSRSDNPEFWAQRQNGGYLKARAPIEQEIISHMNNAGYKLALQNNNEFTYDQRTPRLEGLCWPREEHYLFERA